MITRILGVTNSGHYFNELYLISFFVFIFSFGLDYSVISWLAREPNLRGAFYKKLIQVTILFTFLLLFSTFVILPFSPYSFNQSVIALFLYGSGNMMLILFQGLLSSLKKFSIQNKILLSVNILFSFYLVYLFNDDALSQPLQKVSVGYAFFFFIQGLLMLLFSFEKSKRKGKEFSILINKTWYNSTGFMIIPIL